MKAIFDRLWAWFTGTPVSMLKLISGILAQNVAQLLIALEPIAINAVLSIADETDGKAKKEAAFEQIEAIAIAQGIKASASVINTSIELTVQALKAKGQIK